MAQSDNMQNDEKFSHKVKDSGNFFFPGSSHFFPWITGWNFSRSFTHSFTVITNCAASVGPD